MEESEKRKERLRMMRNEASEAEGSSSYQSSAGALANPLVETPTVQDSPAMSRFDYYTDPMSAYSGNKRPNVNQSPRDNSMSRGVNAARPNPMMQYPPPPPFRPVNNPQMPPPPNYYANQGMQQGWRPPSSYGSGPMPVFNPQPEHQRHNYPNQPSNYHPMPRPGYWANNGPPFQNQGRGGTPFPNQGRGRSRGQWMNNSPGPGGSGYGRGGRGVGHRSDATSAANLYRRSMVEDPWKGLEPVVWSSARSSEMFRKLSSDTKKPRVEEASSNMPKSNESLADYLAAAFDEAVEGGDASSVL